MKSDQNGILPCTNENNDNNNVNDSVKRDIFTTDRSTNDIYNKRNLSTFIGNNDNDNIGDIKTKTLIGDSEKNKIIT